MRTRGSGNRVLIVDDDTEFTLMLAIHFHAEGFRPTCVTNGREALDWIEENGDPDVILLDIDMPIMNGTDFMMAYDGAAPIVIVTGWSKCELPRRPFQVVYKPYRADRIIDIIIDAIAASGGPKWKRLLPCEHACVTLDIQHDELIFTCLIPGCNKSKAVHKDKLDFQTVLELTLSVAEDNIAREDNASLS